ncbi:hypothetical protein C1H46_017908 [Malus baccata]|uniref:Uncharacterized protein n=1 Tax=Malus baccata TaxID=106549 RepID=A0A540MCE3_MALBA|nr:hypothetical protein C1H46_017908 [Malus baccata]
MAEEQQIPPKQQVPDEQQLRIEQVPDEQQIASKQKESSSNIVCYFCLKSTVSLGHIVLDQ